MNNFVIPVLRILKTLAVGHNKVQNTNDHKNMRTNGDNIKYHNTNKNTVRVSKWFGVTETNLSETQPLIEPTFKPHPHYIFSNGTFNNNVVQTPDSKPVG